MRQTEPRRSPGTLLGALRDDRYLRAVALPRCSPTAGGWYLPRQTEMWGAQRLGLVVLAAMPARTAGDP